MKCIVIIFSILSNILCGNISNRIPKTKENNYREYGGKVKRIVEYDCAKYWVDENPIKIAKSSCKIYIISEFNPDEILMKKMTWSNLDYPNEPDHTETNKVNEDGLIIENSKQSTGRLAYKRRTNYSYNQAGFETEEVVYKDDEFDSRKEYIYDEYNCCTKEIWYDENNAVRYYYVNEYDNKNRNVSCLKYDDKNEFQWKNVKEYVDENDDFYISYSYDVSGKIIRKRDRREAFKTNKVNYLYGKSLPDKRFPDIEYYSNKKIRTWHFKNQNYDDVYQTYDRNGRIIERKIYRKEVWQDTFTWKYREDGSIIEESNSTSRIEGKSYYKKTTYYRVDFNGNWVEKYTMDSEGNVSELAMRDFEYY